MVDAPPDIPPDAYAWLRARLDAAHAAGRPSVEVPAEVLRALLDVVDLATRELAQCTARRP